jgi:hydrogenase maturation protease
MHARVTPIGARTRCPALVAGFGRPGMRDLDFGRQLVRYLEDYSWPDGVVVEDLSYAAPLVLHRLQELEPARLVLVGAVSRGSDPPGTLRRRSLSVTPPPAEVVQRCLEQSAQGIVDIDHTLAVARHWGGLPADSVVIEIEPADCSFGIGFSEEMAESFDSILATVAEELKCPADWGGSGDLEAELASAAAGISNKSTGTVDAVAPSDALRELIRYGQEHPRMRNRESHSDIRPVGPGEDARPTDHRG